MSYNPQTGLVYIPSNNVCMDWAVSEVNYRRGVFYLGAEFPTHPGPGGYMGELVAWDPVAQKKVWGIKEDLPFNGGTLTTAGNLVFSGNLHGMFRANDAKTGGDGIGGVSVLASETFESAGPSKRPSVQVGDPFTEKVLIEACQELFEQGPLSAQEVRHEPIHEL